MISVVIPVYNVEKYLRECIDSVIQQKGVNVEIICVNDGSSDGSLAILDEYRKKHDNVHVISYNENKGTSFARNRGLEIAQGKYVYFLDSDDYILENALCELSSYAESRNTDCIFFNSGEKTEMQGLGVGSVNGWRFGLKDIEGKIIDGPNLYKIMQENGVYASSVCRQFWKKDFLINNDLFFEEGYLSEDLLFTLRAIFKGKRMMIIERDYHVYRRRGGSMLTNLTPSKAISKFKIYCRLLKWWGTNEYAESIDRALTKHMTKIFEQARVVYMRNKDKIDMSDFEEGYEQHLYSVMLRQDAAHVFDNVAYDKIEKLKKNDHVIVYGAGAYAVDVVDFLNRQKIQISHLAVTAKHENTAGINGIQVSEIKELVPLRDDAIVVLGVAGKNRKDVLATLQEYGFSNYMTLD